MADKKGKGKPAPAAAPPPPPPAAAAAAAKPPEKKEEGKDKEQKEKSVQPKDEVGTRKGCRRYRWELKDSNREFWSMGHAVVKILSLGCLIGTLVAFSSLPVHPILPLIISMEIAIFTFFIIIYTFAINRYMPFILWPVSDLLNDLFAFAFLVGAVIFAVRIRSSLPTLYLTGLDRTSHLHRHQEQHQQQHQPQPRQHQQPKEKSDLEEAPVIRNGSVFYSKPLSPLSPFQNGFLFHFNDHLCVEKKCLFKSILKAKVAVNIILFIQQKLLKVVVQRAAEPSGGLGEQLWVTPPTSADQPEGPREHENLESKRMHFVHISIFRLLKKKKKERKKKTQAIDMRKISLPAFLALTLQFSIDAHEVH
nr:CKLF-like MARVEL transmembrane domain-containing protein 2 isoform X1 [Microcebus murinus]